MRTVRPTNGDTKIGVSDMRRLQRMRQPRVAGFIDLLAGPKRAFILDLLGALIHNRAVVAAEGFLVCVAFNQVLADFRANTFEQEPHMPQHRIISEDGMRGLHEVAQAEGR